MTEIIDFDKEFGTEASAKKKPAIVKVKMFDRDWSVLADLNSFMITRLAAGDPAAIGEFIVNAVVPEQRTDWQKALGSSAEFDNDKLVRLVNRLVEVITERPTKSPSVSPSSATKRTSGRKSTAVSS